MKKLILSLAIGLAMALPVVARQPQVFTPSPDPNTTNIMIVDCRGATSLALMASGVATNFYMDTIQVTNTPVTGQQLGIWFTNGFKVYTWTNNPPVTNLTIVTNLQITVGVTNGDAGITGTNGLALNFAPFFSSYSLPLLFAPVPNGSQIAANLNSNILATNVFTFLTNTFPQFTAAWLAGGNVFTLTATNPAFTGISSLGPILTNLATVTYTTNSTVTQPPVLAVGLTGLQLASPRSQIIIGVTNATGDAGTASNCLALTLGSSTFNYVITNAPGRGQILASNTPAVLATNLFNFLTANFPSFTVAWSSAHIFTVTTATNDNLSLTNTWAAIANSSFTNTPPATVYLATNSFATNQQQIVFGTNANISATNLLAMLGRDFPSINAFLSSSNTLTLMTYGLPLALTNFTVAGVNWGTNTVATNSAVAQLGITAAVGNDLVGWQPYPNLNLTLTNGGSGTLSSAGTNAALNGWWFVQLTLTNAPGNMGWIPFKLEATPQ